MSRFAVRDGKMSGTDLKSIAAVIEGSQDYSAADSRCDRYVAWRNVFRAASRTRDTEGFLIHGFSSAFSSAILFSSRTILFHKLRDYDIFRHRRFCSGGFDMENRKYILPVIMLAIFETVAVTLWLTKDNLFYLFNFSYIGLSISLSVFLFFRKYKYARRIVQLLVGLYMLIYLGLICSENMQIEGFWYYLFTGVFEAATIHYAIAKIFGPLLFGRGWCGYACWTAMVLDFLPYKIPTRPRKRSPGSGTLHLWHLFCLWRHSFWQRPGIWSASCSGHLLSEMPRTMLLALPWLLCLRTIEHSVSISAR